MWHFYKIMNSRDFEKYLSKNPVYLAEKKTYCY